MRRTHLVAVALVVAAVCISAALARQAYPVSAMKLPIELPVVGNIESVNQWHFGRLESVDRIPNSADIGLTIRIMSGQQVRIVGPPDPLIDLAFQSNWVSNQNRVLPGRADYVERMIAFDADQTGRLIAMASLEPMNRDRNRMFRAFSR